MPVLADVTHAADRVPGAPLRKVHDHSFVGVDHALDGSPDVQAPARKALLAGAATLTVESQGGLVSVSVTNSGAGHSLPSGFAFARQMWIELVVIDDATGGTVVFTSGAVANPRADLCDAETLAGPLAKHVEGCAAADPLLASFQQKLVDRVVPKGGADGPAVDARGELVAAALDPKNEVVLQHLEGGALPRIRQSDGIAVKPLVPGETRRFTYELLGRVRNIGTSRVTARLLFRALPPYFVRALMDGHPGKTTALESLDIVEMARATATPN